MNSARFIHLLKYPLFFGGGFFAHRFYKASHINEEYSHPKTEFYKDFLTQNSLSRSIEYERFTRNLDYETFFETGLLKKLEGVSIFNVYFKKEAIDKINASDGLQTDDEKKNHGKIYCVFSPNSTAQGHHGVVHGGFSATLLDNLLGHLSVFINNYQPCATANLNINYKKPIYVGQEYLLIAEFEKQINRKIYLKSKIVDSQNNVCLESESLFITVDWKSAYLKGLIKMIGK